MKNVLIAAFALFTTCAFSQKTTTWVGGTPGKETSWNEARNWSSNRVPDEFSDVIIPDVSTSTFSAPVILNGTVELNSLLVESNARFTVKPSAKLFIYEQAEGLDQKNLDLKGAVVVLGERANHETVAVRQ